MEEHVFGGAANSDREKRPLGRAMWRGFTGRCPHCNQGKLFRAFLKPVDACSQCGEEFHHHRADDLPAYLDIVIVGHVVVAGFMFVEITTIWPMWLHLAVWVPLTILLSLLLLNPIKGAVVGLQWALYMHGFDGGTEEPELIDDFNR